MENHLVRRVTFLDPTGNEFTGELVGYQIVVDGDGCDIYFDAHSIDVVSVMNVHIEVSDHVF